MQNELKEINYRFEDFGHPYLKELRRRYKLEELVKGARSDFERFILLRGWVYGEARKNAGKIKYDPFDIYDSLALLKKGLIPYCTRTALVFTQASTALGLWARVIEINNYAVVKGLGHTIVEAWCREYKNWMVMDPMLDIHFELNSQPLSALEIHRQYEVNNARDVKTIQGVDRIEMEHEKSMKKVLFNFHLIYKFMRNDYCSFPGKTEDWFYENWPLLYYADSYNEKDVPKSFNNPDSANREERRRGSFFICTDASVFNGPIK